MVDYIYSICQYSVFYTVLVKLVRKQCWYLSLCLAYIVTIDESNMKIVAPMTLTPIYWRIFHDQRGTINQVTPLANLSGDGIGIFRDN